MGSFSWPLTDTLPVVNSAKFSPLHLMPTCGTQYYRFDGDWTQVYAQNLTEDEKQCALKAVETEAKRLGYWEMDT